jgi:HTH-type transcriptional regulator / antitoxin HigA
MNTQHKFEPDYAVAPGETLKDVLDDREISQAELAARTGLTTKTISQIINGAAPLSYDTAEKLELALGVPARFWNARESMFREATLKLAEQERLDADLKWVECIPVRVLEERRHIKPGLEKGALVREVLKFFKVSSIEAWDEVYIKPAVQFRGGKVHASKPGHVAAWLRMGEIAAEKRQCKPYDAAEFEKALKEIRRLMPQRSAVWQGKMIELCANAGVAVVFVEEIAGASVSGVTKWLSKDKAMIVLSLKYKSDDQFWFTFFHEACHVLKHSKKTVFYEFGDQKEDPVEKEADKFARDVLIPPQFTSMLPTLKSKFQIQQFALQINAPPGIVVGRLQHDGLCPPSFFQGLKGHYTWNVSKNEPQQEE